MARFYADENVPLPVVKLLRSFDHNILTAKEAKKANLAISDEDVLMFATNQSRIVLTGNKRDFINLHRLNSEHSGIVVYSEDVKKKDYLSKLNILNSIKVNPYYPSKSDRIYEQSLNQ